MLQVLEVKPHIHTEWQMRRQLQTLLSFSIRHEFNAKLRQVCIFTVQDSKGTHAYLLISIRACKSHEHCFVLFYNRTFIEISLKVFNDCFFDVSKMIASSISTKETRRRRALSHTYCVCNYCESRILNKEIKQNISVEWCDKKNKGSQLWNKIIT